MTFENHPELFSILSSDLPVFCECVLYFNLFFCLQSHYLIRHPVHEIKGSWNTCMLVWKFWSNFPTCTMRSIKQTVTRIPMLLLNIIPLSFSTGMETFFITEVTLSFFLGWDTWRRLSEENVAFVWKESYKKSRNEDKIPW